MIGAVFLWINSCLTAGFYLAFLISKFSEANTSNTWVPMEVSLAVFVPIYLPGLVVWAHLLTQKMTGLKVYGLCIFPSSGELERGQLSVEATAFKWRYLWTTLHQKCMATVLWGIGEVLGGPDALKGRGVSFVFNWYLSALVFGLLVCWCLSMFSACIFGCCFPRTPMVAPIPLNANAEQV